MYSLLAFNPRHEFHWILSQWIIPAVKALVTVAYLGHCVCLLLALGSLGHFRLIITGDKRQAATIPGPRLCLAENSSARWCPLFVDARGSYEECWEAGHQGHQKNQGTSDQLNTAAAAALAQDGATKGGCDLFSSDQLRSFRFSKWGTNKLSSKVW